MLLVMDVGNTNIGIGLFEGKKLIAHWRLATDSHRTSDEYGLIIRSLYQTSPVAAAGARVQSIIVSSVVPPMSRLMEQLGEKFFGVKPVFVGPGIKTGMPILYDNPREVGADRIVNAVAAYTHYRKACIIVDFGTATTFDCVSAKGEYLGGAICPGIMISAEALFQNASKLPRVEIVRPKSVIGRTTVQSIQSGMVFGYAGMVDALVRRLRTEMAEEIAVVATGGLATLIAAESAEIQEVDENLTLEGLRLLHEMNRR